MAEPGIRAFVCGHPIAHSRSPLIHGHWLERHGISGSYERIDVAPADIAAFFAALPNGVYAGGNVTIPHKEAAFAAAGWHDAAAAATGAVNTLWLADGRLCGGNTDAAGFAGNLDDFAPGWRNGRVAIVIGAGGAARAVIYALAEAGYADIRVVNRTLGRGEELGKRFGAAVAAYGSAALDDLLFDADLLVNTTSIG
ncbi:MAG: shikimate dehydrogenase, partial [Mesorhizobium sp.]|nr:shikimate dehydrogenase [Mesorhizobium sp.]